MTASLFLRTAITLALSGGIAVAQIPDDEAGFYSKPDSVSDQSVAEDFVEFPVRASELIGQTVFGADGESVGIVEDVVLLAEGPVRALVVRIHSQPGLGEKLVAIPFDQVEFAEIAPVSTEPTAAAVSPELRVTVNMTRAELEQLPPWQDDTGAASATAASGGATDSSTAAVAAAPAPEDLSVNDLMGSTVFSLNNEVVGEVGDVILNSRGDLDSVAVDVGGFLGAGETAMAVDMDALDLEATGQADANLVLSTAEAQLDAAPPSAVGDPRIVEFLFATNRGGAGNQTVAFDHQRTSKLKFGAARVRVPEDHKIGRLELPTELQVLSWSFWREREDPERHFTIKGVALLGRDDWVNLLDGEGPADEALIFVHGFNTSFEQSLYRTAQIVWDLQYRGRAVLFSWPSRGELLAYEYDRNSALTARDSFIALLRLLQDDAGIERIHVLAHSMGNFVVLDALANHARVNDPVAIGELIMAAPDIDVDQYRQAIEDIRNIVSGLTLYASSTDKAMLVSRNLAQERRAGDLEGGQPVLVDGVDEIDVTAMGDELLGLNHDTFAATRSLLNDIKILIGSGKRPPHERLAEIRRMPVGTAEPLFWKYAP